MARHHFCCCLPLRLGALLIALFQFLVCAAAAALMWFVLLRELSTDNDLSVRFRVATGTFAAVYTVIALMALAGFLGAVAKKPRLVRAYASTIAWVLGVQIGLAVVVLVAFFLESRSKFLAHCIAGSSDPDRVDYCNALVNASRPAVVVSAVLPLLVQAYGVWIIAQYSEQLADKENRDIALGLGRGGYKYAAAASAEDTRPLTQPPVSYPYADASHSYGNTAV